MYIIIRNDLTLAQQLVQSAHAAHEAGIRFGNKDDISSFVVCSVPDEIALRQAAAACTLNSIRQYLFQESDLDDQATAFATEPISGEQRRAFRKLPLWKPQYENVEKVA